jgi:hypothetical protein
MNNSLAIVGSGSEDIGCTHSNANCLAESLARDRRLDADAIVFAALSRLEVSALDWRLAHGGRKADDTVYIAGYVQGVTGRPIDADHVAALLADIRAQLSPLVRG